VLELLQADRQCRHQEDLYGEFIATSVAETAAQVGI